MMPTPAFDEARLRGYPLPAVEHRYVRNDTILYALGVGAGWGRDDELRYLYEQDLVALPTMAVVLGTPGFWVMDPALGLDWLRILHGEQSLRLHRPLPPAGTVVGTTSIGAIADKGTGRSVLIRCDRILTDGVSGAPVATLDEVWVLRGAGGYGGADQPVSRPFVRMPEGPPVAALELPTFPQQAALYRLTGDCNPLHIDPAAAVRAGFPRPILHGLATFGLIGRALIALVCGGDAQRLSAMRLRFVAPVYPGDIVRTEVWNSSAGILFRASVPARGDIVVDGGVAERDGFGKDVAG